MSSENCSKCPVAEKCKAWKAKQIKLAGTPEVATGLEEIMETYCPISDRAMSKALNRR